MKQDFPASAYQGGNISLEFDFIFQKAFPSNLDAAMRLIYSVNGGTTWDILQTYPGLNLPGAQTANPIPINSSNFVGFDPVTKKLRIGFLWRNKAPATAPNPAIDNSIVIDNIRIVNRPSCTLNSVSPTTLCTGAKATLNFTQSGFLPGTVFSAQLSDGAGNFGNPIFLGNLPANNTPVTIPNGLPTSPGYKIRIVTDNGFISNEIQVAINLSPERPFAGGDVTECHGESVTIGGGTAEPGVGYAWNVPALGTNLAPTLNLSNLGISFTRSTYILTATRANCTATDTVVVTTNPLPVVDAGVAFSICDNELPVLMTGLPANNPTSTPSITGVWTGAGLTGAGNSTTFNPSGLTGPQTLTYTVSANWKNGGPECEAKGTRVITVKEAPDVQAGDPETFCTKAGIQAFTGTAGGIWSGPGIVSASGNFNPAALLPGLHVCTLTVTNNGCTNFDTKNVTITAPVVVNAGPDTLTLCSYKKNHTMTGFVPPAETFGKWSSTTPGIMAPGGTLTFDTTKVGFHKLFYTYEKDNCRLVDSVLLTIVYAPVARSGPSNEVCANDSCFVLTGQYPAGGKWTGLGVDTSGTVFCPDASLVGSKLIKYKVNYSNGCFSEASRVVLVKPAPIIQIGKNDTICASQTSLSMTQFTPPGGIWTGPGISESGLFKTGDTLLGNITVKYTVTNASGCIASKQKQITVNRLPRAIAGLDTATCTGLPLLLGGDSIPNLVYKWFEPIPNSIEVDTSFNAIVILTNPKPTVDSFFVRLTVLDTITNCQNSDTVKVRVLPRPQATAIFPGIKELCAGDSFILKAVKKPEYQYQWLRNGLRLGLPSPTADSLIVKNSGRYELVVRNLGAECPDTSLSDTLTIFPRFVPRVTGNLRFCKDSTTQLGVSPKSPGFTYEWQYNNANVPDSIGTTFTVGKTGTVRVILRTDRGCQDSSAIYPIDSLPFPTTGILNDTVICENQRAVFKAPVDSLYQYRWIDSSTRAVISTNDTLFTGNPGKYYLEVYNFCRVARDSVSLLRVNPLPRFGILNNGRKDTIVCVDLPVKLFGPLGYQRYVWTTDSSGGSIGRLYNVPTGDTMVYNLALRVTDQFECSNSDTIRVKVVNCAPVLYIPSAFSPQGDQINDVWRVQGYSIDQIKIYVYNRWGQMVYYSEKMDGSWDGAYKGTPCPSGSYKYVIEYSGDLDGQVLVKKQTGNITILR
jgi:gliding motility-associated-like protein